ncbi:MAG: hypothetical protein ACI9R3_002322 [Verrucomicrobiales bacterium]|jgi:uncharacterized protein HemX
MSEETKTEAPQEAVATAPAKKKSNKDPLAGASILVGVLGIAAVVASIVVSLLF